MLHYSTTKLHGGIAVPHPDELLQDIRSVEHGAKLPMIAAKLVAKNRKAKPKAAHP